MCIMCERIMKPHRPSQISKLQRIPTTLRTKTHKLSKMFRSIQYFLAALLIASVSGAEVKNAGFPLSYKSDLGCVEMIATHAFNGDCCSLKATADDGCVLVVVNGNCVVSIICVLQYTLHNDQDS